MTPAPPPGAPDASEHGDVAERRRMAALAGHLGDERRARQLVTDASAAVRATALGALGRLGRLTPDDIATSLRDPAAEVRRRACEEAVSVDGLDGTVLVAALGDGDPLVVEGAAWAVGERGGGPGEIDALVHVATTHADPLCREAAVAALGALGDDRGLPAILRATTDKPAVRRRAILALAPFEGEEVTAALQRALQDRDWQVRQAAEDLIGAEPDPGPVDRP